MGLDMYLTKTIYVGSEYEHRGVSGTIDVKLKGEPIKINFNRVREITESVGYWRKANQIHNWFVNNVQEGEDDCKPYSVSEDDFKILLDSVRTVLKARETHKPEHIIEVVNELLPPQDGFFFGSTEVDDWYWQDLEYTEKLLVEVLEEIAVDRLSPSMWVSYYYQSSW